jgi:hypothetical protein
MPSTHSSVTYLDPCLREGRVVRWATSVMPIPVYIAPFTWYEPKKQQEAHLYRQMVLDCLEVWRQATNGVVSFRPVASVHESQIDLKWRRIDRRSLGLCHFNWNQQWQLYSAEIEIGITDGVLHGQYNDPNEVRHTILHEIGHALGLLGHSPHAGDMMYVPHQYGVTQLSPNDVATIQWLYRLPVGFSKQQAAHQLQLPPHVSLDAMLPELFNLQSGERLTETPFEGVLHSKLSEGGRATADIEQQQDFYAQQGQFFLATSFIQPSVAVQPTLQSPFRPPPHRF